MGQNWAQSQVFCHFLKFGFLVFLWGEWPSEESGLVGEGVVIRIGSFPVQTPLGT